MFGIATLKFHEVVRFHGFQTQTKLRSLSEIAQYSTKVTVREVQKVIDVSNYPRNFGAQCRFYYFIAALSEHPVVPLLLLKCFDSFLTVIRHKFDH